MHRRSAVGRLAATVAGLTLGEVPSLEAAESLRREPFSVTGENLPDVAGMVTCPLCQETGYSLELTPAGLCLRCADRSPVTVAQPHADPFWILSPREIRRAEAEIQRLAAELDRMNRRFAELRERQIAGGGDEYDRAMEAERDEWLAVQRELHLLHLLRAASRQFSRSVGQAVRR